MLIDEPSSLPWAHQLGQYVLFKCSAPGNMPAHGEHYHDTIVMNVSQALASLRAVHLWIFDSVEYYNGPLAKALYQVLTGKERVSKIYRSTCMMQYCLRMARPCIPRITYFVHWPAIGGN